MYKLILASASPRRAALLTQMQLSYQVLVSYVDESLQANESAEDYVQHMSKLKAKAVHQQLSNHEVVLAADTVVVIGDQVLGKPADKAEGIAMLELLSASSHKVLTAVTIMDRQRICSTVVETQVTFRELSIDECERYWSTGEPWDKAGAYAIQGLGAVFVNRIEGSYSNVVGLPICETAELLNNFGINCLPDVCKGRSGTHSEAGIKGNG